MSLSVTVSPEEVMAGVGATFDTEVVAVDSFQAASLQ